MKRKLIIIKTVDTEKEYTFELGKTGKENPQLWKVEINIACVDSHGNSCIGSQGTKGSVYVERETLEDAGLIPRIITKEDEPKKEVLVEDLILGLLEYVGVYPEK